MKSPTLKVPVEVPAAVVYLIGHLAAPALLAGLFIVLYLRSQRETQAA